MSYAKLHTRPAKITLVASPLAMRQCPMRRRRTHHHSWAKRPEIGEHAMRHKIQVPILWLACLVQCAIEDRELDLEETARLWDVLQNPDKARLAYCIQGVALNYRTIRRDLESTK